MRWAVLVLGLVACAPTAAEVRTARTATYDAPPAEVFALAMQAANEMYGVATVDRDHYGLITRPFLDDEAGPAHRYRGLWSPVRAGIVVRVVGLPNGHSLVTTTLLTQRATSSCRYPCRAHWVDVPRGDVWMQVDLQGASDRLALAIYKRAKRLATR